MVKVLDPVCGVEIDTETAPPRLEYDGQSYYFCSRDCAREFEKRPAEILEQHEPPFTTKGGITAPKFGSAGSGGAEYELLPEAHTPKKAR